MNPIININILKGVVFASFRVLFGKVHKLYAGIIFFLLATSVEQLCESDLETIIFSTFVSCCSLKRNKKSL